MENIKKENKTTTTSIRISPDVLKNWRELATNEELSLSDWIRSKVDNSELTGRSTPNKRKSQIVFSTINPQLIRQLALIGNNLNQVSKALNFIKSSNGEVNTKEIFLVLDEIKRELLSVLPELPPPPSESRSTEAVQKARSRNANQVS